MMQEYEETKPPPIHTLPATSGGPNGGIAYIAQSYNDSVAPDAVHLEVDRSQQAAFINSRTKDRLTFDKKGRAALPDPNPALKAAHRVALKNYHSWIAPNVGTTGRNTRDANNGYTPYKSSADKKIAERAALQAAEMPHQITVAAATMHGMGDQQAREYKKQRQKWENSAGYMSSPGTYA